VEIVDSETLKPVAKGETGKILVTNIHRKLMPSIRYDAGDLGRWVDEPCKCGRKTRRFELLGRSDDVLIIGGGNIFPEHISEAVHSVEGVSEYFQMIAVLEDHLDKLVVRVEKSAGGTRSDQEIITDMESAILKASKDLKEMVRQGLIAPTEIVLVEAGGIERNPKTGKIRVTIDERK
jgi:phenylacetate-coenzyme A ligase PaaK-like adenylate-forming protein